MKIIVTGYGRHGKDTVCEYLKTKYNLAFESSSMFCARAFIAEKMGYNSPEEAYEDRHNHRQTWYDLIHEYNQGDLAKMGRNILTEYDIYCGLRDKLELNSIKHEGLVDIVIWVDRSKILPPESNSSISITADMCDYIVDNNSTLENLYQQLDSILCNFA